MNKQISLAFFIQIAILAIPVFFWNDIKNEEIKFSMALFVLVFYGCAFFRILESYIRQAIETTGETKSGGSYFWLGIMMQIFLLIMFYVYSKRVFEILND